MTWLCLLSSADVKTGVAGAMSMDLGGQSLDHWRGSFGTLVSWDNSVYAFVMFDGFVSCYEVIDSGLDWMAGLDWDDTWGLPNNYLESKLVTRPYFAL